MSKQKTRKSALKRFKVTGSGKILHRSKLLRHLRSTKSKKRIRRLKMLKSVEGRSKMKVKKMLGI